MFRHTTETSLREEIDSLSVQERSDAGEHRLSLLKRELAKREKEKEDMRGMIEVEKRMKEVRNLDAKIHEIHERILKMSDEMGHLLDQWREELTINSNDILLLRKLQEQRRKQVLALDQRTNLLKERSELANLIIELSKKHNPYHGGTFQSIY